MKNKTLTLLVICTLVFLTACDSNQASKQAIQARANIEPIENIAWMREKLPGNTLAYMRIPTIWGLFFEEKADGLHSVQRLEEHKSIVNAFKQGMVDSYADLLPDEAQTPFTALIKNMSSPLEVAVLNATDNSMVPNIMVGTTLKGTTKNELGDMIQLLSKQSNSQIRLSQPFDEKGFASAYVAMSPVFISFNEKSGQLLLLSGLTASQQQLKDLLAQTQYASELEQVIAFEKSVDTSGRNIEFWLNIQAIYQQNKGFISPSDLPLIKKMGLDQVQYMWAGTASSAGKSEFVVKVAMPEVGFKHFISSVNSEMEVQTAGVPRSAWQIARPTVEQFVQGFELAISFFPNPQEVRKNAMQALVTINNYFGVSLAEIFNAYGQKILIVTDDSGTWFASKILDKQANDNILEKLKKNFNLTIESKSLAGVDINVMETSAGEMTEKLFLDLGLPKMDNPFQDFKSKSYYQIQNDYYIQALTPQVLADRANSTNKLSFSNWLDKQQGQNWNTSIFAYSKQVQDAPRDIYYFYLKMLEIMGNITHTEVDLFSLPTAQQLNLPKQGQFSFALDSSEDGFAFKLSYEYSIFENMSYVDSYLAIAYIGVVSAYAIPAYRDYTMRSKVAGIYYSVYEDKGLIVDHYAEHNSFPGTEFLSDKFSQPDRYLYNPKNGEIIIYFDAGDAPNLSGYSITLTPIVSEDGYIDWECHSDIMTRHLPNECR